MKLTKLGNNNTTYTDQYDPSLLEKINRQERRKDYIYPMYGGDIWTAFEFSFLLPSGLPQFHVIRIWNPCDSENIFESKSLKLYLNSFNNTIFNSLDDALDTIARDLQNVSKGSVIVKDINSFRDNIPGYENLDLINISGDIFSYEYDRSLLKICNTDRDVCENLSSTLLRSNCEITNQPDWASIFISYVGKNTIDKESLLRYIISYRKHQEFHEPTCERIYQDLYSVLQPEKLVVICQYTRRGGIDINPIRISNPSFIQDSELLLSQLPKLIQQ